MEERNVLRAIIDQIHRYSLLGRHRRRSIGDYALCNSRAREYDSCSFNSCHIFLKSAVYQFL